MKTTLMLAALAFLNFASPAFSQQRPPNTLPPKKVKSQTILPEPSSGTPSAGSGPVSSTEAPGTFNAESKLNTPQSGSIFFRKPEGYPQHELGVNYEPNNTQNKWNFQGTEFKYDNTSWDGYGLVYRYRASPAIKAELAYSHNSIDADADSKKGLNLQKSTQNYDTLFIRADYSWIGAKRYFYGYGLGLEVGQDSFPTLEFVTPATLHLAEARDLMVGINAHTEIFLLQPFSYRFKVGYDQGTRAQHMGGLPTTKNNFYYAEAGTEYMINEYSSIEANLRYSVRNATVTGPRGASEVEWDTDMHDTNLQIGYFHNL